MSTVLDVIVIGAGQAGLALGYYLRNSGLDYLILDAENQPGGAWQHTWDSLQLFSPAQWSSLPGTLLPGGVDLYPGKPQVLEYFSAYEKKYELTIERPVMVENITKEGSIFQLKTNVTQFYARAVISATGTFREPKTPKINGLESFKGLQMHSSEYVSPGPFKGKRIGIVGEGNSGAQLLAELSQVADTYWLTKNAPDFLPTHVDGKYLFDAATQLYEAKKKGKDFIPPSLGDIVMVPKVQEAKKRGVYEHYYSDYSITDDGFRTNNGQKFTLDVLLFCTGFRPAIGYLKELPISFKHDKIKTHGTRAKEIEGLWMVGYGSWTGFASATVIGVGRSAKQTIADVVDFLKN